MRLRPVLCVPACIVVSVLCVHAQAQLPQAACRVVACCAAFVLAWVALVLHRAARPALAAGCVLACIALTAWSWAASVAQSRLADRLPAELEGIELQLTGVVDALPVSGLYGVQFGFQVESCEPGCEMRGRVQLSWGSVRRAEHASPSAAVVPGERWRFTVRLKRPHAPHNPGAFDRELRWLQEGVAAVGSVRSAERLDAQVFGVVLAAERFRHLVRRALPAAINPSLQREAGVLAALSIGDQAAISPALWSVFNQTGVGHLMSISGLHITMLAGLGGSMAGCLWRSRVAVRIGLPLRAPVTMVRLFFAVGVAWAYALIAGWGIPAQRTCFMLTVAALLLATGRLASILAAVGVAGALITCLDPWAPLAAGFWLSFGAVLAIVWACTAQSFHLSSARRLIDGALRTQWAATIALIPLGALFFGAVSIVGPIANAVAIPLVSIVITPLALAGGALAPFWPEAAGWVLWPALQLTAWLLWALEHMARWPGAVIWLTPPQWAALLIGVAGCVLLLAPPGVPRRAMGALALLPLLCSPLDRPGAGEVRLAALDVGQGTAVVVQAGSRVLVFDAGPSQGPQSDSASRVIVPWLRRQGVHHIDALIISHLDNDHSGGAATLIREMTPDWVASSLPPQHAILAGARHSLPCRRGEQWEWEGVRFRFLHPADPPEPARGSPTNALSCVLQVQAAGVTLLLAGDIEAAQERRLVTLFGAEALRADVLLVPHHGSRTSSTDGFIDAVAPRAAIVQVAYRSRFGHPHPVVMQRYLDRGIDVLRSDHHGAILLRVAPNGTLHWTRSRLTPPRYWRVDAAS
jgi:competence protein ComEC